MNTEPYIIKGIGGFYYVKTADGVVECRAKGIFRKRGITPVAGDRVRLEHEAGTAVIAEVLPRKNVFVRPPVANVDQFFIVASTVQPAPSTLVIDKLSAIAVDRGAQPVLGYNYGAGEYRRVKQGILFMTAVCLVYMLAAWGLVFVFPHELMGLFTDNQELVDTGAGMLHIYFFGFCFMAFQMSGQATFTGLGKAKFAIFFSLFRKVALVLPLIFILPNFLGVDGVLWSEPISNLVGGGACFLVMMLTLWRKL